MNVRSEEKMINKYKRKRELTTKKTVKKKIGGERGRETIKKTIVKR